MIKHKISLSLVICSLLFASPTITFANTEINQEIATFQELEDHLPQQPIPAPYIFINVIGKSAGGIQAYNNYISLGNEAIERGLNTGNIYHYHTALINYDKALQIRPGQIEVGKAIKDLDSFLYDYHMRQGYKLVREAQRTRNYYYYQLALDNFTRASYRKSGNRYVSRAINNVKKYLEPNYLNTELQQAICTQNWRRALNIIQTMKEISHSSYSPQLNEYRAKFLYILNHNAQPPTYPPESYCASPTAGLFHSQIFG